METDRLTAEQVCEAAEHGSDTLLGQRRIVYRIYRQQDDSHLWPIQCRFNVIERAIRRLQRFEREAGGMSTLEACYFIEAEESRIVNEEV